MTELKKTNHYETITLDEHLELRQLQPQDTNELFAATEASREYLRKWLPWVDGITSPDNSRQFIEWGLQRRAAKEDFGYGIFMDSRIAGHISLMNMTPETAEIGYWVTSQEAGRGIATRTTEALVELAFSKLGMDYLTLRADIRNTSSQRVAEKAGFKQVGKRAETDHLGVETTVLDFRLDKND